jgi:hypothetical protein
LGDFLCNLKEWVVKQKSKVKQFSIDIALIAKDYDLRPHEAITGIVMSLRTAIKTLKHIGLSKVDTEMFKKKVCNLIMVDDVKDLD